jgi:hypothetical protein
MDQNRLIRFEYDAGDDKVEIHLNENGIVALIEQLEYLRKQKKSDHLHLMTEAWGGDELTGGEVQEGFKLINHVKIYRWD